MRTVTNRVETLLHMGSESLGPFRSAAGATEKDGYVRLKKNWSCSRRNTSRNQSRHTWPGQARTMVNVETIARRAVPFGTRNHFSKHRFSGQLALRRICFVENITKTEVTFTFWDKHHKNWCMWYETKQIARCPQQIGCSSHILAVQARLHSWRPKIQRQCPHGHRPS